MMKKLDPAKIEELREKFRLLREKKEKEKKLIDPWPSPRYDKIYWEGIKWLDENG